MDNLEPAKRDMHLALMSTRLSEAEAQLRPLDVGETPVVDLRQAENREEWRRDRGLPALAWAVLWSHAEGMAGLVPEGAPSDRLADECEEMVWLVTEPAPDWNIEEPEEMLVAAGRATYQCRFAAAALSLHRAQRAGAAPAGLAMRQLMLARAMLALGRDRDARQLMRLAEPFAPALGFAFVARMADHALIRP